MFEHLLVFQETPEPIGRPEGLVLDGVRRVDGSSAPHAAGPAHHEIAVVARPELAECGAGLIYLVEHGHIYDHVVLSGSHVVVAF